jgi:hypothetical protein
MNSIRLRSPGDVVAVLPYQLGYHPHDSLVVVALRDRAVVLVERVDLPTAAAADEAAQVVVPPLLREDPDAVLLVAYETSAGDGRPGLEAVRRELVEAGITVLDRMVVRGGRWFAVDCVTGCCPPDGSPVPSPADTPAVAEFVGRGISPLPGRGALAALVAADPGRTPAVARALRERAAMPGGLGPTATRFEALSAWAVALGPGAPPTAGGSARAAGSARTDAASADPTRDDETGEDGAAVDALGPDRVALLVDSLRDVHLRDGLVAWLCPGSLPLECLSADVVDAVRTCLPAPGGSAGPARLGRPHLSGGDTTVVGRRHLVRLQHLVRVVPDEHAAAPLTVLANLAWWLGDGALARTCLERALDASPGYRLALLLERMLDLGIRPRSAALRPDGAWAG